MIFFSGTNRFFTRIAPPIVYAKGNNATILQGIPFNQRGFAEPGFLQFRAFDVYGFPNAICPGVRYELLQHARPHCFFFGDAHLRL